MLGNLVQERVSMSKTSKALTAYLDCRPPAGQSRVQGGQKRILCSQGWAPLLTVTQSYKSSPREGDYPPAKEMLSPQAPHPRELTQGREKVQQVTHPYPAHRSWCLGGMRWQHILGWAWVLRTPTCPSACHSVGGGCVDGDPGPSRLLRTLGNLKRKVTYTLA
jgi:hypothetical protein